ncbi:unnamed protein product [Tenebrio molitor]|nr:unnamed protein product [Tenebrio molitor]
MSMTEGSESAMQFQVGGGYPVYTYSDHNCFCEASISDEILTAGQWSVTALDFSTGRHTHTQRPALKIFFSIENE